MPYMTYPQLKNSAKSRMKPVMGKLAGAAAAQIGLTLLINQFTSIPALFNGSFALQMVFYFLSSILCATFSGLLEAGASYLFLKLYCGRPVSVGDLFYAFTNQTKTCLGVSFILSLINTVPTMPAYIFFMRFAAMAEEMNLDAVASNIEVSAVTIPPEMMNTLSIALFCFTPALILMTILGLIYAQVYYLMLDFPSCSVRELFRKSRILMHGHKGRLFYIQVCFLPLYMLIVITCGVGVFWIMPFVYAVQTEFYLDLVTKRRTQI